RRFSAGSPIGHRGGQSLASACFCGVVRLLHQGSPGLLLCCSRCDSLSVSAKAATALLLQLLFPIYFHWKSVVACCRIFTSPFPSAARLAMPLAALLLHIGVGRRPSLLLRHPECSLALLVFCDAIRATKLKHWKQNVTQRWVITPA